MDSVTLINAVQAYVAVHHLLPSKASPGVSFEGKTWSAVDKALTKKGSSLSQFLIEKGFKVAPWKRDAHSILTEERIVQGAIEYYLQEGSYPQAQSGDATPYLGVAITWGAINDRLRKDGTSLSKLLISEGLKPGSHISKKDIISAIKAFKEDKGKYPHAGSGKAILYFGYPITWNGINSRLKKQGLTLGKFRVLNNLV